ncbi:MAG: diguanylate cyclase [Chromatiales bacterium]|jgi:diguanylate cyclase (GGDEF)-like protein
MQFDIRTLLVAVALASVFCAAARFLLWRIHPAVPGLGHWALASVAGTLALLMIFLYGIEHWLPALSLAQLFVVIGLVLAWDGFRRFIGRPPVSRQALALLSVVVLIWIAVATFQHSLLLRALGNAILVAGLSALIARELLTSAKPIPPAMRVTGWMYAFNAAIFLIRVVAADHNATPVSPLNPDGFAPVMLLWWLCMTIAVTLGMVLMTAERLQVDLDKQANHDPLTGALNRRSFPTFAQKAISQSRRCGGPLSLLMMDLDRFKQINDQLGHNGGDELLCRFVDVAGHVLRNEDIFCRFGGEEFIALLPNTSAQLAQVAAERLRTAFAAEAPETMRDVLPFDITVSIGIAELGQDDDIESLLHRADTALYKAKRRGRNCCEVAEGTLEITNDRYLGYVDAE